jgi:hypothetical protein
MSVSCKAATSTNSTDEIQLDGRSHYYGGRNVNFAPSHASTLSHATRVRFQVPKIQDEANYDQFYFTSS